MHRKELCSTETQRASLYPPHLQALWSHDITKNLITGVLEKSWLSEMEINQEIVSSIPNNFINLKAMELTSICFQTIPTLLWTFIGTAVVL
jgi:hypothetical protein